MKKYFRGINLIIDFGLRYFPKLEVCLVLVLFLLMFYFWSTYPESLIKLDAKLTHQHSILLKKDESETYLEHIGNKYGTYGDSYGSLNALFSGVASLLLLLSLVLQRQELQAQRKELAAQREEISKANDIAEQQMQITEQQAKLLEKQIEEAQVQNFFNIFFPLINRRPSYYEIADKIPDGFNSFGIKKSDGVFKSVFDGVTKIYRNFDNTYKNEYLDNDEIKKILKDMKYQNDGLIKACSFIRYSGYIKHFEYMINFIQNFKGIGQKDKSIAMSIFISDFSTIELMTISIFALEDDELLAKIKKYKLLQSTFRRYDNEPTLLSSFFND